MNSLEKFYRGKKVLITGHSGFKGSWLSRVLLLWGAKVSGISLKPNTSPNLCDLLNIRRDVKTYIADVRRPHKILGTFSEERPEIVFHLAAQPIVRDSYDNPLYTIEANTLGTANVLEAIRTTGSVRSAVMVTTDKVYENTNIRRPYHEDDKLGGCDPYSGSKAAAEMVISSYTASFFNPNKYRSAHTTLVASARAGNIIGGGDWSKDRIIPDLVRAVFEHGKPLTIRNPEATRPWQHVLEPLFGYLMVAQRLYAGDIKCAGPWNFGPGSSGHNRVRDVVSGSFAHLGQGSFVVQTDPTKPEAALLSLNSSRAKSAIGWAGLLSVKDALAWTLDWYSNFYAGGDPVQFTDKQVVSFTKICSAGYVKTK